MSFTANQPVSATLISTTSAMGALAVGSATAQGLTLVSNIYNLGPEQTTFSPPAQLTFEFSTTTLASLSIPASQIALYEFFPGTGWVRVSTQTLDLVNNVITSSFTTLASTFALLARVDRLPPRTALVIGQPQAPGSPTLISAQTALGFTAQDDRTIVGDGLGLGVKETEFAIDSGTFQAFTSSFTIAGDGTHIVRWFSLDVVGNVEVTHSTTVVVDALAPQAAILAPAGAGIGAVAGGVFPVIGSVNDAHLASWRLEAAPGAAASSGFAQISSGTIAVSSAAFGAWNTTALTGWQTLRVTAVDAVLNTTAISQNVFIGDPIPQVIFGSRGILNKPMDAASTGDGTVYVADRNSDRIAVFSSTGALVGAIPGAALNKGQSKKAGLLSLNKPAGVALDAAGNLWIADSNDSQAVLVSPGGQTLATIVGLASPDGIALDAAGSVYVSESGAARVRKYTAAGTALLTYSLPGSAPAGLAIDQSGDVYVADPAQNRVAVFGPSGALLRSFSPGLSGPLGVAVDATGDAIWVSDSGGNRLLRLDRFGDVNEAFAPPQDSTTALNDPAGLFLDAAGALLVADRNDDRVIRLAAPGAPVAAVSSAIVLPISTAAATRHITRSDGGKVNRADGAAVELTSGTLAADLDITVSTPILRTALEEAVKARKLAEASLVAVSTGVEYLPEGTTFTAPVTLVLPYDPAAVAAQGLHESDLRVYYWNRLAERWEPMPSSVDLVNHAVNAQTTHFSL